MLQLKSARAKTGGIPSIDMTPMIDMVFQVLIFFMLTSIFVSSPVLDLTLPVARSSRDVTEDDAVHLFVDRSGGLFVDDVTIPEAALRDVLKAKLEKGSQKRLLLSADRSAPFGFFVHVMDVTQGLGVQDLALETAPPDSEADAQQQKERRP